MGSSDAVLTANTKIRPKAYQFIEGRPAEQPENAELDKENEDPRQCKELIPCGSPRRPTQTVNVSYLGQDVPPSTPATRLPLADLIGNADETCRLRKIVNVSPEEHITWHALQSPKSSSSKRTPGPNRPKRHRSSSPPSSSVKKKSYVPPGKDSVEFQSLNNTLVTPQTDPATELWNRYAVSSTKDGIRGSTVASFSNLLKPSSPQSASSHLGTVGGLRRWTSCGVEWPSSKAKRRKTRQDAGDESGGAFGSGPVILEAVDEEKRSRIGSLIERIHESLTMPPVAEEPKGPSSSSPLPERSESFDRKSVSPTRPNGRMSEQNLESSLTIDEEGTTKPVMKVDGMKNNTSSSSFGSDDLDLAEFDLAEEILVKSERIDKQRGDLRPDGILQAEVERYHDGPMMIEPMSDPQLEDVLDDDEFDDGNDLSMADLEAAASLYDGQHTSTTAKGGIDETAQTITYDHVKQDHDSFGVDEFGDDDLDEESFVAAEAAATQSFQTSGLSNSECDPRAIQRYLITSVVEGDYTTNNHQTLPEKVLVVEEDQTKKIKAITLRQSWYDTRCTKGAYVHVIGAFTDKGQCLIDDAQNMLILHPDHLISALVVADSFGCLRRAVLQDRIKATSEPSAPQIYGTMLHETFQEALTENKWDIGTLHEIIERIVARHIEDLYEVKLSVGQAREHLQSKMPELQAWSEVFVRSRPEDNSIVKDRNGKQVTMSINKLLDVEEHIWSPMYGLKGNIDATVQVMMRDEEGERVLTVPLEVKTGKNNTNTSHRAQTALYTLLLGDRYDIEVAYGVLYYLENSEISRIPAVRHELRHMIMQRNELACYVRERLSLPPMLKNAHVCNRCYAKVPCLLYHKLVEDGTGETSGLRDKFDEVVKHLKPSHQEFFTKWDHLLTKEESEMMKFRRELWTMLSSEREKLGRCFANVVLEPGTASEEHGSSKINRFKYTFRKQDEAVGFSFSESHLVIGEPIVISDEKGHYALARGYVTSIQKHYIGVAVDRRLHNARKRQEGFDAFRNQTFEGIMDVDLQQANRHSRPISTDKEAPILYRLDKDEFSNGLATVRNNLIQIMANDVFRARELRFLVVDGMEPRFKHASTAYTLSGPLSQMNINEDQRAAIDKVMAAEDYALVLGMPGTGKTTTIAHLIRAMVAKGKSVLLTSYTHTAVDNILLKIREDKISILRLGATAKVHPEVREVAILGAEPKTSIEELEKAYQEPKVVATTCLGINHPVFNERIFDYCIVDEASQITLPVCLGPIRLAKTFVLVGDHYQLPPLVQNREAQEGGLDVSLFRLLSERHPSAVVTLHHQYRMNSEIMSLSNTLIYSGRLKCGTEAVAKRRLVLPNPDVLLRFRHSSETEPRLTGTPSSTSWIEQTLGPDTSPVIFLNTDTILPDSLEKAKGARMTNPFEANLISSLARALLLAGIPADTLGIITLYRSQLALIKSLLTTSIRPREAELLEAHTADRFQGRDKDVILLSCVRSNDRDVVGELLKDWRRVNVAVTRAKKKLVIVGSKSTLGRGDELLGRLVKMCEERSWVVDLPVGANEEMERFWNVGAASQPLAVSAPKASSPRKNTQPIDGPASKPTTTANNTAPPTRPSASRIPLQPRPPNTLTKAFKVPRKIATASKRTVLGSGNGGSENVAAKRPMFRDIVNDVVGEGFFD